VLPFVKGVTFSSCHWPGIGQKQPPISRPWLTWGPEGFSMLAMQPWDWSVWGSWPWTNASSLKMVGIPHPHERILTSYRAELLYQVARRPEMCVRSLRDMRAWTHSDRCYPLAIRPLTPQLSWRWIIPFMHLHSVKCVDRGQERKGPPTNLGWLLDKRLHARYV